MSDSVIDVSCFDQLTVNHYQHLRAEGFSDRAIAWLVEQGVRSIDGPSAIALGIQQWSVSDQCWCGIPGLYFPFSESFGQVRADHPRRYGNRLAKYVTQSGKGISRAWVPSLPSPGFGSKFQDPQESFDFGLERDWIVATEGYKDAAAGTWQGRIKTLGLAGVSHWRSALQAVGQKIDVLLHDADGRTNPQVFYQLLIAASALDCKVQLVPEVQGESHAGLCEWFREIHRDHRAQAYSNLVSAALKPLELIEQLPSFWMTLGTSAQQENVRWLLRAAYRGYSKHYEAISDSLVRQKFLTKVELRRFSQRLQRQELERSHGSRYFTVQGMSANYYVLKELVRDQWAVIGERWCQWSDQGYWVPCSEQRIATQISQYLCSLWRLNLASEVIHPYASNALLQDALGFCANSLRYEPALAPQPESNEINKSNGSIGSRSESNEINSPNPIRSGNSIDLDASPNPIRSGNSIDLDAGSKAPPSWLSFKNGTLDTVTGTFKPRHQKQDALTYRINADYCSSQRDCPQPLRQFLIQSYGEDLLEVIRMAIWWLINPRAPYGKFLFLVGHSGSGKGTLIRFLSNLFPLECVASCNNPSDLATAEGRHQLLGGKAICTFPDTGGYMTRLKPFYELVDNGMMSGRALFKSAAYSQIWNVKFIAGAVTHAAVENGGDGWKRRALILPTLNHQPREIHPKLDEYLATCRSQAITWALSIDPDVAMRLYFQPEQANARLAKAAQVAEAQADACSSYVDECFEFSYGNETPVWLLHEYFKVYCKANGYRELGLNAFVPRIKTLFGTKIYQEAGYLTPTDPGFVSGTRTRSPALFKHLAAHKGLFRDLHHTETDPYRSRPAQIDIACDRSKMFAGGIDSIRQGLTLIA